MRKPHDDSSQRCKSFGTLIKNMNRKREEPSGLWMCGSQRPDGRRSEDVGHRSAGGLRLPDEAANAVANRIERPGGVPFRFAERAGEMGVPVSRCDRFDAVAHVRHEQTHGPAPDLDNADPRHARRITSRPSMSARSASGTTTDPSSSW